MKVTAIMGGLGQSIPGSMRSCLFGVLNVQHGQPLLNRGATSSLGPAAVNIAVDAVAIVTANSRRRKRFPQLQVMGVYAARVGGPDLVQQILKQQEPHSKFDAVLNLVGNSVLLETFDIVRRGGIYARLGGSVAWHQSQTLTPWFKWLAGFTSAYFVRIIRVRFPFS